MDRTEAHGRAPGSDNERAPGIRRLLLQGPVWLALAWVVALPGSLQLRQRLLGDPRIDVWNHAWGFGWVADTLATGALPWRTDLVGAPEGGVLYFIDLAGAVCAAPVTLLAGPALGYNLTLLVRTALAGFAGQQLATRLFGPGPWTWVGGVGCLTLPFLLAELGNGISEVAGVAWVLLALVAAARATDTGRLGPAFLTGVLVGWAAAVSFYYGFLAAVLCGLWLVAGSLARRTTRGLGGAGRQALAVLAGALPLGLPPWLAFRASLQDPSALVRRPDSLNLALLEHNAVDPRVFVMPGPFQSVDLATEYGEPFVHTAYLRWTVLVLVVLAAVGPQGRRRIAPWLGIAAVSVGLGLGDYLWWGGSWVRVGDNLLSLPFSWLKAVLPQVAITHPLRLSIGGQLVLTALAAGGARWVCTRTPFPRSAAAGLALLVAAEGALGSAAAWPLPTSDARVPAVYASLAPGPVLDLPVEAGTTMRTSRWFWLQTEHGQPIPWTPDVRLGSARDPTLFAALSVPNRQPLTEQPHPLDAGTVATLRSTYGTIVLHRELARELGLEAYEQTLTQALGTPEAHPDPAGGELWVWRL